MCQQLIGIAQCAPVNPEQCPLTFVCGQLHHYAGYRELCEDAKGGCVCFFGTCGRIDNLVRSQSIDLARIPKFRCLACTNREEQVGERRHGRDFLETPLLTREAVGEEGMVAHAKMLRECWGGVNICPFHDGSDGGSSKAPSKASSVNGAFNNDAADNDDSLKINGDGPTEHNTTEQPTNTQTCPENNVETPDNTESKQVSSEAVIDTTTSTPIKNEPPSSDGKIIGIVPLYPQESPIKNNDDTSPVRPLLGIETSRWAPGGAGKFDTASEPENGQKQTSPGPRRELYNIPKVEPGNSAIISDKAIAMRAFMGIK